MFTPDQFKSACGNLLSIVKHQSVLTEKANIGDKSLIKDLDDADIQLKDDTLKVLVMGKFSSGKSTFLNALMGQPLLPAKPTPTTAVIGEIVYADSPEAILYSKKDPKKELKIKLEDLSKYIVIDHNLPEKDIVKKENPYKKIVIKYPLSVCKHGIMFVDSPGLDDPTCHDAITKEYLPSADAIVYCMSSSQAFSAADKMEIERLVSLGYKSIVFVLTYFDVLQNNDEIMGTKGADEARQHYTKILSKYTDLGCDGIFFVGSLPALKAKRINDRALLEQSNFPPFEKRLEEILFNEKGRMKLMKALYSTRRVNRKTTQQLNDLIDIANSSRDGLRDRITAAQSNLNQAQAKANLITTQFNTQTNNLINRAKDKGHGFFLKEVLPNIKPWAMEFVPAEGQSISVWHPKRTASAFTEACLKYVQSRIEARMAEWCEKELVQDYLYPELERLTQEQDANLQSFEEDLKNVRAEMNLSPDGEEIADNETPGAGNRIVSAIAGLFLNPASLVAGAAFGWRGLVSSLVAALVGGLVLGIISLFTPVGWTALIITWIVAGIVGTTWSGSGMEDRIKEKIASKMCDELQKKQEEVVANIGTAVGDVVKKIQKAVEDSLNAPVDKCREILAEAERTVGSESNTIQSRVSTLTQLRAENAELAQKLDDFAQNINA